MENTVLKPQLLLRRRLLTGAQTSEILSCTWHDVGSESHLYATCRTVTDGDVEVDHWVVLFP